MKNLKSALALAGWLLAAALSGTALAQDLGLYAGASGGEAEYKRSCDGAQGPCSDNDSSWRAFGGYRFNPNFSLELGYADLGSISATPNDPVTGAPGTFTNTAEVDAFDLSGVMSILFTRNVSGFFRLGWQYSNVKNSVASVTGGDSGGGFLYGAGVGFDIERFGVRLEWIRYDKVGGIATGEDVIDVLSIGALVRF